MTQPEPGRWALPKQAWEQPCLHMHVCKPKAQPQMHRLRFCSMHQGTTPGSVGCKDQSSFGQDFTLLPFPCLLVLHFPLHKHEIMPQLFPPPIFIRGRSPDPSQELRYKHVSSHLTMQSHYTTPLKPLARHTLAAHAKSNTDCIENLGLEVFVCVKQCMYLLTASAVS